VTNLSAVTRKQIISGVCRHELIDTNYCSQPVQLSPAIERTRCFCNTDLCNAGEFPAIL